MRSIAKIIFSALIVFPLILSAQIVPERDDPGAVLGRFNAPRAAIAGLAWDDPMRLIWGTNRVNQAPCRLWAYSPDEGQIVHDYEIDQQGAAQNNGDDAIGLGFDPNTNLLWVNQWNAMGSPSVANLYDRDGRAIERVSLPRGGHWDFAFDEDWLYGYSEGSDADRNDDRIYRMTREIENVTVGPNLNAIANHGRSVSMAYVPQHEEGHFWLMSVGFISQFTIDWANNEARRIVEFPSNNNDYPHQGLTHDGFNLIAGGNWNGVIVYTYDDDIEEVYGEIGFESEVVDFRPTVRGEESQEVLRLLNLAEEQDAIHILNYEITDLGGAPDWLSIEPASGTIEARESADITITASTNGLEVGEYEREILVEVNDPNHRMTIIPVNILVVEGRGRISGRVTDANGGAGLAGVTLASTEFDYTATSDDNGDYSFEQIGAWEYSFTVSLMDYLPIERQITVRPGDDLEENFALLHSAFSPRPDSVYAEVQFDLTGESSATIVNTGNGTLVWQGALDFPDEIELPNWSLINTLEVSQITGDARIQAVAYVGDRIYVAGAADGEKLIYIISRDGELLGSFPQLSQSRYGFSSLVWDGTLLWGAGDQLIYGFNLEGDSIDSFLGPIEPAATNLAWDPDMGVFWVSGSITPIYACNRQGEIQRELNQRRLRTYGMGYFPDDPDGCGLYLYTNPTENSRVVMKINTTTNDTIRVIELPNDGGRPTGASISYTFDPFVWTFFGISNIGATDKLYQYQIQPKTEWIEVSPTFGEIAAGESADLTINFDAAWLTPDILYQSTFRVSHNGVGGMTALPIVLGVTLEGGRAERAISLDPGWNLVSTNILPEGGDNFPGLLAPLVESGSLIFAKDGAGNFYWPEGGFDGIDEWDWSKGYWLKTTTRSILRLGGEPVDDNSPINMNAGWNLISYIPRSPIPAEIGFQNLGDNLLIARDGNGRFYLPAYNFSDLDRLHTGAGYQVKVSEATEFVYSLGQVDGFIARYSSEDAAWIDGLAGRSASHSLLVLSTLPEGTRLEALTPAGVVAGRGVTGPDGLTGFALWADDPMTSEVEGFSPYESVSLRLEGSSDVLTFTKVEGDVAFTDGGLGVVRLENEELPISFALNSAYPNPFNGVTRLTFTLPESQTVRFAAYDLSGRMVAELASGKFNAGFHRMSWDASTLATGVYYLKLESGSQKAITKVVLLK